MTDNEYMNRSGWDLPQGNAASNHGEAPKQKVIGLPIRYAWDMLDYLYYLRATHDQRPHTHTWQDSVSQINAYILTLENALKRP